MKKINNLKIFASYLVIGVSGIVLFRGYPEGKLAKANEFKNVQIDRNKKDNNLNNAQKPQVSFENDYTPIIIKKIKSKDNNQSNQVEANKSENKSNQEILKEEFINYAKGYQLDDKEIEAILIAMNSEMNIIESSNEYKVNPDNLTITLNNAIDKIANNYYADNNQEAFKISKAIIMGENYDKQKELLDKSIDTIASFKENPNKENYVNGVLAVNDIIFSSVADENGYYLDQNRRDVAVRLYSNYMYAYSVNNGYNTNANKEIMDQLNYYASIPYTFTYTDNQINCDKVLNLSK